MIVYRVEHHLTRKGPWSYTGVIKLYDQVSGHEPLHGRKNGPYDEGGAFAERFRREGGIFGCISIPQLMEWFPSVDGRRVMADKGYVVSVYRTPFVAINKGQNSVAFQSGQAVLVRTLGLLSMMEEEDAAEEGQVEGNHRQEHQGNEEGGLSAEAGGSGLPQSGTQERR